MTQVNSPFFLSKLRPADSENLVEQLNNYLDEFERIVQQVYQRTGGQVDIVDDNEAAITSNAYVMSIANQSLQSAEELESYNYSRYRADIDDIEQRVCEIEARQCYIISSLDSINEQLSELEALSYGYQS